MNKHLDFLKRSGRDLTDWLNLGQQEECEDDFDREREAYTDAGRWKREGAEIGDVPNVKSDGVENNFDDQVKDVDENDVFRQSLGVSGIKQKLKEITLMEQMMKRYETWLSAKNDARDEIEQEVASSEEDRIASDDSFGDSCISSSDSDELGDECRSDDVTSSEDDSCSSLESSFVEKDTGSEEDDDFVPITASSSESYNSDKNPPTSASSSGDCATSGAASSGESSGGLGDVKSVGCNHVAGNVCAGEMFYTACQKFAACFEERDAVYNAFLQTRRMFESQFHPVGKRNERSPAGLASKKRMKLFAFGPASAETAGCWTLEDVKSLKQKKRKGSENGGESRKGLRKRLHFDV